MGMFLFLGNVRTTFISLITLPLALLTAILVLDRFLDDLLLSGLTECTIIHGKGTGVLRAAVQQSLRGNRFVKKFRLGVYGEGEDGVTIAEFKE